MNLSIRNRLETLEAGYSPSRKPLPTVLSDDATDAQIAELRASGIEAYRFGDVVGVFI